MSRQFCEDVGLMFELSLRVFQDSSCFNTADAVCLFGQTIENEDSMLKECASVIRKGTARLVAVSGYEGITQGELVVLGYAHWCERLTELGVPEDRMVRYPLSTALPPSTDAEALGLIAFAEEQGWRSLYVTVPPLHQMRAFVSTVSAAKKLGVNDLRIYNRPGWPVSWDTAVIHSQSAPRAPRAHQIAGELAKMDRYHAQGDHLPATEVLKYLNWRDGLE